jgi:hypothetical protein
MNEKLVIHFKYGSYLNFASSNVIASITKYFYVSRSPEIGVMFKLPVFLSVTIYRLSEKSGTKRNFNYFYYFYLQVNVRD